MNPYIERLMAKYVQARVEDGELPEDAARDACIQYEVDGAARADFIDRYATHSVRAERIAELVPAAVATQRVGHVG